MKIKCLPWCKYKPWPLWSFLIVQKFVSWQVATTEIHLILKPAKRQRSKLLPAIHSCSGKFREGICHVSHLVVMYGGESLLYLWILLLFSPPSNFIKKCVAFLAWTSILHAYRFSCHKYAATIICAWAKSRGMIPHLRTWPSEWLGSHSVMTTILSQRPVHPSFWWADYSLDGQNYEEVYQKILLWTWTSLHW